MSIYLQRDDSQEEIMSVVTTARDTLNGNGLNGHLNRQAPPGVVEPTGHDTRQRMSEAIHYFKRAVHQVDKVTIKNHDQVPEAEAMMVPEAFLRLHAVLGELLGDPSGVPDQVGEHLGIHIQQEFLPYLLLTQNGERWYAKPRGYAGDFLTIEMIYQNSPAGWGRLGPLLDRCLLDLPAARAVRHRRGLLAEAIADVVATKGDQVARVTSLACGPARELFDVFPLLENPSQLHASLIDFDLQALAFVAERRDRLKLQRSMSLINENLIHLAVGRRSVDLKEQDLIYSVGLIDYLSDPLVLKLLDLIHTMLAPGGKVILGNFHPRNPCKAFMDHVLEWRLIHRTEDDMHRLYAQSAFGRPCTNIRYEQEGINLFAECIKAG